MRPDVPMGLQVFSRRLRLIVTWALAVGPIGQIAQAQTERSRSAANERLNLILISLDTVRPDHLSCYGYHRQTTLNIDRIAKEGVLFTQAFAQGSTTFPSHLSFLTSRYPTRPWVEWKSGELEPSTVTLTELLKQHHFATAAFIGMTPDSHLKPLLDSQPFMLFNTKGFGEEFRSLSGEFFEWLAAHHDRPFFLFLHGFDAHDPRVLPIQYDANRFDPGYRGTLPSTLHDLSIAMGLSQERLPLRELYQEKFYALQHRLYMERLGFPGRVKPRDVQHLKATYDAQLYYLDQGIGKLLAALKNLKLMDHTLIILVSDHGEGLGEHGFYNMHHGLYDEIIRTVLIVRDPRLPRRGRKVAHLVQLIDVMPTLLELLGLPIPSSVQGRSLVPLLKTGRDPNREELAVSVGQGLRAIRTPTWKLICQSTGDEELYHLTADPREQRNVISRYPDKAAALRHRLDALVPEEVSGSIVDIEQVIQEQGYW